MNVIRSHCHEVYIEEINKIALSSDDDKRVIVRLVNEIIVTERIKAPKLACVFLKVYILILD